MIQVIKEAIQATPENTKLVGDAITAAAVLGTLVGYLPPLAAFFTIIWTGIRILETKTMKRFIDYCKAKYIALKAKVAALFQKG